jgi:hypothetical protein
MEQHPRRQSPSSLNLFEREKRNHSTVIGL